MNAGAAIRPHGRDTDHRIAQICVCAGGVLPGMKRPLGSIVGARYLKNECVAKRCRGWRIEVERVLGPCLFVRGCRSVNAKSRNSLFHPLGMGSDVVHGTVHLTHGQYAYAATRL